MRILFLTWVLSTMALSVPSHAQTKRAQRPAKPALNKVTSSARTNAPARTVSEKNLVIGEISVEGQRKIEKDAILARLKSKKGDAYSAEAVREDVLSLFRLGYFNDIVVDRQIAGSTANLVFRVVEKPSVAEITYEGNSEIKTDDLVEGSGLKAYELLNMAKIREATEKLAKLYEDKGYFLAKIEPQVVDIKADETVRVVFKITEGEKVKVKKIIFVGNQKLTDATLKANLYTQEEGYFTALSGSGSYKQEAFERDIQMVRFTYYNQGYIQAKVDRPQVSVTPDKKGIYLTIRIEEGLQYNVGEVDFDGDLLFPKAELHEAIQIDKNGVFAYDVLQRDLQELQAKYGDLGYAYTNVVPQWVFHEKERKVDLLFVIDKGSKVYFGRFDMVGNTKTRDKVIRREMKIREGELYNETRRRQSVEGIQRLGFFDEVNFKTSTPAEQLDVMNIEVVVKERNTGQVQVSAGYGTTTGFTFGGSVQQTNFLGKGQNLGVTVNVNREYSMYDLSFTEPYWNDTDWSVGYRVFQSSSSGRLDYTERRTGASVQLGHPISENVRAYLSAGYTAVRLGKVWDLERDANGVEQWVQVTDDTVFPLDTAIGDAATLEGSVAYDTRNDRMYPSRGIYARLGLADTGLLGGNLHYFVGSADFRFFQKVFWDVVWRNSVSYARIGRTGDREVPFNELYLLGGPYSLRGYRYARVGRMVYSQQAFNNYKKRGYTDEEAQRRAYVFFGGEQKLQYLTELQFPLVKEANMFGVMFYDVGQAENHITGSNFYADWGFGLRWFSPIGPLRFEWGFPMDRNPLYHENGVFEFSIGTPF